MPIVSNTSPLLNLAIIEHLHLLQQQFPTILTPHAVYDELQLNSARPGTEQLKAAFADGWLQRTAVTNVHLVHSLRLELDGGESEAIALALECNASYILLDESDGRSAAKLLGLQPIGVLGILLRAKTLGQIVAVKPLLLRLRTEAGFFIAPQLETSVLLSVNED
ncbi:MAG: DUF3368 domain-containing protein [Ardenticatenaceae bacterium]|nr:DUF3368 domain-containing protein [Ardenticatenaceae bacterium]